MTDSVIQKSANFSAVDINTKSLALVFARFLLANEFMLYGTRKFLNPPIIYQWIENFHLPGNLVYLVIPWQIFFGWMTFLAIQSRLASAALFGFCNHRALAVLAGESREFHARLCGGRWVRSTFHIRPGGVVVRYDRRQKSP